MANWDINHVVLVGRIAHTPELKYTPNGHTTVKLSIAVSNKPGPNGEERTSFIYATVWGKQAENLVAYKKKGDQIGLTGELCERRWTARDGGKRSVLEVNVDRVQYLRPKQATDTGHSVPVEEPPADDELPPTLEEQMGAGAAEMERNLAGF